MTRRPPALLPMVISVAVALGMLALAPLFTAPVLTTNLMLTVGVPGLLAAVTERRIPHVVRIAGCLYDRADLFEERPAQLRMDFRQFPCYVIAQRLAQ